MHHTHIVTFFSAVGAQSLILPFVAAVAITLWLGDARREARIWLFATCSVLFTMLVLKLFFLPCGHLIPEWHLRSPSGHAASAFAIYGSFAVLEARLRQTTWQKLTILILGFLFAAGIAISRVLIGAHTTQEVLLGAFVGLAAPIFIFWKIKTPTRNTIASPLLLALALPIVLLVLLNGRTLPIEDHILAIALTITQSLGVCL